MSEEEQAKEKRPWPAEPPRMSEEDLRAFVLGLCDGKIWTSNHNNGQGIDAFSMMLMFKNPPPREYTEKIGLLWEWLDKAGPRAVNNQPSFFSMRILHIDDWNRAFAAYQEEMNRREEIRV